MEIRFAEPRDVTGILNLLCQIGKVHHRLRPDLFQPNARKYGPSQLLDMLKNPDTPIFVAVQGDTLLGYGFCKVSKFDRHPVTTDHTNLFIDDLCVDENHRGEGVGTMLYRQICRYAQMRKCHNVTLNVWADNEKALKFYEKLGLKPQKIQMETILGE